jgi:hypothetical protein
MRQRRNEFKARPRRSLRQHRFTRVASADNVGLGEAVLGGFWEDPDFDPGQRAFYYVRILEIPTPTWLAYDKVKLGTNPPAEGVFVHQERAYTSPIWYTPRG